MNLLTAFTTRRVITQLGGDTEAQGFVTDGHHDDAVNGSIVIELVADAFTGTGNASPFHDAAAPAPASTGVRVRNVVGQKQIDETRVDAAGRLQVGEEFTAEAVRHRIVEPMRSADVPHPPRSSRGRVILR